MGYLTYLVGGDDVERMLGGYVNDFLPALVLANVQRRLENSSAFEAFEARVGRVLVDIINKSYEEQAPHQPWPAEQITEMHGIAAAARETTGPATNATFERLMTVNYGFDLVSARVFAGKLGELVLRGLRDDHMRRGGPAQDPVGAHLVAVFANATDNGRVEAFRPPAACDAFGAVNNATKRGHGAIFARDFQLPTANIFQSAK